MKKTVCAGFAAVGSLLLFAIRRRQTSIPHWLPAHKPAKSGALASIEGAAHRCMIGLIVPVWIGAGLLDYYWHRRTKIETTSGTPESALHLIMLAEGCPIVLGPILLEVNAGVLSVLYAAYFAHQATAMWDIDSTVAQRLIPPDEQHIHAFLEGVPFCIMSLYTAIHWSQFLALLGLHPERPRFDVRLKQPKVPLRDALLLTTLVTLFDVLPHVEEFWRCRQAQRRGLLGRDTPECARELFGKDSPLPFVS